MQNYILYKLFSLEFTILDVINCNKQSTAVDYISVFLSLFVCILGEKSSSISEKKIDHLTVEPFEPLQGEKAHVVTEVDLAEKILGEKGKDDEEDKTLPTLASVVAAVMSAASSPTSSSPNLSKTAGKPSAASPAVAAAAATAAVGGSGTSKTLVPPTANGPTSKVTQRQRHGPLNLTLDLSVTNLTDLVGRAGNASNVNHGGCRERRPRRQAGHDAPLTNDLCSPSSAPFPGPRAVSAVSGSPHPSLTQHHHQHHVCPACLHRIH